MASVSFTQPPLIEIVFSVEFVAPGFSSIHFGLYWESIRSYFPLQQDSEPIILEEHENTTTPLRRVGFISNDRRKIIQLQENLFIFNWIYDHQDVYPNFEYIFQEFISHWNHLQEWWLSISLEPIQVNDYALAYLNEIDRNMGWRNAKDHGKIFNFITTEWSGFLNVPDSLDFQINFLLPNNFGILSVKIDQLSTSTDEDTEAHSENLLSFELIAKSYDNTIPTTDWFISAHDYIVKAFLELTKEDAQKLWGGYDY
ncbi:MAG: hypothetical protein RLZZ507_1195 [Cyanobacteriota bacterium]|jgi:uncharacterized protein (TIGR04255 family)